MVLADCFLVKVIQEEMFNIDTPYSSYYKNTIYSELYFSFVFNGRHVSSLLYNNFTLFYSHKTL